MLQTTSIAISEPVLAEMLVKGDRLALKIIYENYAQVLFGVIARVIQDEHLAEDALQEAFIKIWKNANKYDETKGRLFTWLVNICRNVAIDRIRSKDYKKANKVVANEVIIAGIATTAANAVRPEHIGLKEIVNKLRPEQKSIIDLVYFEGYTQKEVAEELNIPLGTVKTRMRMAIRKLREIF